MNQNELSSIGVSNCIGYRLHKLEVYNWGTFDQDVFSVRPLGQTTLLVGQNGSGKSTMVDALLTLLVKPGVRNFNVAAGAKKTERDERSYLKGAYDRSGDEGSDGSQVKFLRPKGDGYSVILACFHNVHTAKTFSVAQLLYLGADQKVEKVHCFSDQERGIREDFGGLGSADGVLKTLRQRGWQATRTFAEYETWFNRTIRAKPKAMEVFNQTVAVKDIQRLNDFIRQHMLEAHPWGERVERLLAHFAQLRDAHQSLVRVRQQFQALEPIAGLAESYTTQVRQLSNAECLIAACDAFFSQKTLDLFLPTLDRLGTELEHIRSRKAALAGDLDSVREERRRLLNDIEVAGGPRLREIPILIRAEETQRDQKKQEREWFLETLARGELSLPVCDEPHFAAVRNQQPALRADLASSIGRCKEEHDSLVLVRGEARHTLADNRQELESLQRRRENLPEWCASLRQSLCDELGLQVKDLPFAAELIAVRPEENAWEASIEKVLRGFGLSLLIPQRLYNVVSGHVDRTRLADNRGRGQRLVYLQIGETRVEMSHPAPAPDSLLRKLAFRDGHPLLPWVKAELHRQFDFRCCESIEDFQQTRGQALTRTRHVKSGERRHDKDDREQASDPRNFVLGWDNREKKQRIVAEIDRLVAREAEIQQQLDRTDADLARASARLSALDEANAITHFSEIDFERHDSTVAALELERRAIEEQSDTISMLKQQLAQAEAREIALGLARDEAVAEEGIREENVRQAEKLIANARADLRRRDANGVLERDRETFADLEAHFEQSPLMAETLFEQRDSFRVAQEQVIRRLRHTLDPLKNELLEAMSRFMRSFSEEHDLRANLEYLEGFLGLRRRIAEEDLPRHEQRFKERLNEKVIQEIGLFRGELDRERRAIEDKIDTLNMSLRRLEYRPGTHIRLEPRTIRDPEIVEFQTRLRECIEGSFDDSAEGNEARFVRIQDLLQRLQDENNRRWRDKVTDVRRWFDFVAAVVDRNTLKTVSIYQDSSGQSGGEKAKLAFTILVAAIAYQYDLDPEHPGVDRFHFVVVDEMFSKVDDQHAEYALELFRQFGLQLLIVAPLDAKARVTQPYVGSYLHVNKRENRSEIFEMTAQEFDVSVSAARDRRDSVLPEVASIAVPIGSSKVADVV